MSSILLKAKNLGIIEEKKYIMMRNEFSRNSWLKKEPYDVPIDTPSVIKKSYELITREFDYKPIQIAQLSKIPLDIINDIFGFKTNIVSMKQRV